MTQSSLASIDPFATLDRVADRSTEAVIAQSGLVHPGLAAEVRRRFKSRDWREGALVRLPVIEGAHPFVQSDETMDDLASELLDKRLIDALDTAGEQRFPRGRKPYKHQVAAWRELKLLQPKSVLVTAGTGSGKTECFLVPILDDLARRAKIGTVEGVEAIMLYPLNALIESQKERLEAWTKPFGGSIRYALYNGNTPDRDTNALMRTAPWQVHDRRALRASPPPILVTNITMLEYMLVRDKDRPILDKSSGKLKWIVLDEAHSLVGAAAAEVALLLRRVMLAFNVTPDSVRFVATSATIGDGEKTLKELQAFLADLAGVSQSQVSVITGERRKPAKPAHAVSRPANIAEADPVELYGWLGSHPKGWELVEKLTLGPVSEDHFDAYAKALQLSPPLLAQALTRSRSTKSEEADALAPIRVHGFARAVPGLWSCINPACTERPTNWPFGRVLTQRAEQCPQCSSVALEILVCTDCGAAVLEGEEFANRLQPKRHAAPADEFLADSERERESAEENDDEPAETVSWEQIGIQRLFAAEPSKDARKFTLDRRSGEFTAEAGTEMVTLLGDEAVRIGACPCCGSAPKDRNALRTFRFGAPFIIGNSAPILLEGAPERESENILPASGRQLLSFTDSRQGTARMSAKLQNEAERNFVRSMIYHAVQKSMQPKAGADDEISKLRELILTIEKLADSNPSLQIVLDEKRQNLAQLEGGASDGLQFADMSNLLANDPMIDRWIKEVWRGRDARFADSLELARFLLLRETMRRPLRANSIETLGMAQIIFPDVERRIPPSAFTKRGGKPEDWRSWLCLILDQFVRGNSAIGIGPELFHWLQPKIKQKFLAAPGALVKAGDKRVAWPSHTRSRPVAALMFGLRLDLTNAGDKSDLDDCLATAWSQLGSLFSVNGFAEPVLNFEKANIAPVKDAWLCPVTRRVINNAPFGCSPFSFGQSAKPVKAAPISMPALPVAMLSRVDRHSGRPRNAAWLRESAEIQSLREKGAWGDINDRIAMFSDYARAAEHSAQQSPSLLRSYEKSYKAGEINILNCSTTMEMGVDIGSVTTVMMTNVPPSVANYKQRIGRAGRRGQMVSLGFTLAKDRPLDRETFGDPIRFLQRTLATPRVALNSRQIVQRHVNAWLLSQFLRDGQILSMETGMFFGCPADATQARLPKADTPAFLFYEWLMKPSTFEGQKQNVARIVHRSACEGDAMLLSAVAEAINTAHERFVFEWEALKSEIAADSEASGRMKYQLKRLCSEFLASALAGYGFLPGHGFPTSVVSFNAFNKPRQREDSDEASFDRGMPKRPLDIAIRDYSPGSDVVLDGLVYKSAGVTLNWKRPASDAGVRDVQALRQFWACDECSAAGTSTTNKPSNCPSCASGRLRIRDYLRPAGFRTDRTDKPHADADHVDFVPAQEPKVSVAFAPWVGLPKPDAGRYRTSSDGLVFHYGTGPGGLGYRICLECGRAHAETEVQGTRDNPLSNHYPLGGGQASRRQDGRCTGNDRPFAIKDHLALGHEINTDVFELQPGATVTEEAANALVIALREALARILGIEPDEMGIATAPTKTSKGIPTRSLFLFDRNAGGAGFASSAGRHVFDLISEARSILSCQTPGCVTGCGSCVLVSDAPEGRNREPAIDRTAALQFVNDHLSLDERLATQDQFSAHARLSRNLLDEVDHLLSKGRSKSFVIWLRTEKPWELQAWRPLEALSNWRNRGIPIEVALAPGWDRSFDTVGKLALRDFLTRHDFQLSEISPPRFGAEMEALCAVRGELDTELWCSAEASSIEAGESWGQPLERPIARGNHALGKSVTINRDELLPSSQAKYLEILSQCNGPVSAFGDKLADLICSSLREIGAWEGALVALEYSDKYVRSPIVTRLFVETSAALFRKSGAQPGRLALATEPLDTGAYSRNVQDNWDTEANRDRTFISLAKLYNLKPEVSTSNQVPHGRSLTLVFANGKKAKAVFDQGFGAWSLYNKTAHDFRRSPGEQANALSKLSGNVQLHRQNYTYVLVTKSQ